MKYIISEPLPAIVRQSVSIQEVPAHVLAAFTGARPTAVIKHVHAYTFKKKVTAYEFSFHDATGQHLLKMGADGRVIERKPPSSVGG